MSKISERFMLQRSGWREFLLTTLTKNQRKDASEDASSVVIQDIQSTSIAPEPKDYVVAFYSGKPYVGQVQKIDEEGDKAHINFLEHKGDSQRRSKLNAPKKEDKM